MERVVISSKQLEEFLERLLRWDELCAQLRELYYRYLDLAAFRSEKCYFPGRKCKRSWKREYGVSDLTLMWTYITNTAPLCGKLIRALAEVEYKIRLRALESFKERGGIEERSSPSGKMEVVKFRLNAPVHAYIVLWDDKLYVIWGELDGLPKESKKRAVAMERKVLDIVLQYRKGLGVSVEVDEYDVDREYERLWLEVPLPNTAAKLLGGKNRAPIALFRNLGWLLSDDRRSEISHGANNMGQATVRLLDWIALATYVARSTDKPFIFKLTVYQFNVTKSGVSHQVKISPIGTTRDAIMHAYEQHGIVLRRPEALLMRGYAILNALRGYAFKREGRTYVVDDVGAWIAFSATVATLLLGDGTASTFEFSVAVKPAPSAGGKTTLLSELKKAVGGGSSKRTVGFRSWHMRLLLPAPPMPAFRKSMKLYSKLVNYPAAAVVELNGVAHLLTYIGNTLFEIAKNRAGELYEVLRQLGLKMYVRGYRLEIPYTQLRKLAKYYPVQLLTDMEKDGIREVRQVRSVDLEAAKRVLEEVVKVADIIFGKSKGREYARVVPHDRSKVWEIAKMLKTAGFSLSVNVKQKQIYIEERKSVDIIREVIQRFFLTYAVPQIMRV